jgi:hypothetical protein
METFVPKGNVHGPILPDFILKKEITFGAKIMYALLCDYASTDDYCWPSHATLAGRLSCSLTSVKKYLTELVNEKLIDIRRGQYHYSNEYYLLRPASLNAREAKTTHIQPEAYRQQPVLDHTQVESGPTKPESDRTQPKVGYINTLKNQEERKEPPLRPAQAPGSLPPASRPVGGVGFSFQDFEKTWEAYPKKTAKGFAVLAWKQLRQTGQLPPLPDILAAVNRFMLTESWQRDHGRYIPQFSSFLRGQRWLDPLSSEEEETNRNRLEAERMELARRREQEADEARRKEKRERLRPIYDAFAEKFGEAARQSNERIDAMNFGMWMFLEGKYGGPTAADVPDGTTLSVYDFMKAYQRRRDGESCHTARSVRDSLSDNRANRPMNCANILRNNNFLTRLIPAAQPLCAAV